MKPFSECPLEERSADAKEGAKPAPAAPVAKEVVVAPKSGNEIRWRGGSWREAVVHTQAEHLSAWVESLSVVPLVRALR
jgi:hypothetical protein